MDKSKEHVYLDYKPSSDMEFASDATYEEIKAYVKEKTELQVNNLYIAQVKWKCGMIERMNYNLPKSENARQPKCPLEKEAAIRAALEHFGMI